MMFSMRIREGLPVVFLPPLPPRRHLRIMKRHTHIWLLHFKRKQSTAALQKSHFIITTQDEYEPLCGVLMSGACLLVLWLCIKHEAQMQQHGSCPPSRGCLRVGGNTRISLNVDGKKATIKSMCTCIHLG